MTGVVMGWAVFFVVGFALVGGVGWLLARPTAVADIVRMVRAGMPEPGAGRMLEDLQCRRYRWSTAGGAVGVAVAVLLVIVVAEDSVVPIAAAAFVLGHVCGGVMGAAASHVAGWRPTPTGRTASLQPRRWSDYLAPLELAATCTCTVLGVAVPVLVLTQGPDLSRQEGLLWSALAGICLAGAGLLALVARQVLASATAEPTVAGLLWREWMRAKTLRDLRGGVMTLAYLSAIVPLPMLSTVEPGWWSGGSGQVVAATAVALLVGLTVGGAYSTFDQSFGRFRSRVLDPVAS